MTLYLASRMNHLTTILEHFFARPKFPQADRWLAQELAKNKKFGSKDRRWYSEQFFLLIRHLYAIVYYEKFQNLSVKEFYNTISTPHAFWKFAQSISIQQYKHHIETNFECMNQIDSLEIRSNLPIWFLSLFKERYPSHTEYENFFEIQKTRSALWIRVHCLQKLNEIQEEFTLNSCELIASNLPYAFRVESTKSLLNFSTYLKGFFEIQDYASQQIIEAVDVKENQIIWDVCAGGGGKTLNLASKLDNTGTVYASDIRTYKLPEIEKRLKRANILNVKTFTFDASITASFEKKLQIPELFDRVLIDAPCSSSGTWRRNPDAKYRVSIEDVFNFSALQNKILNASQSKVKTFGKLIYATCSLFCEENENIIQNFLNTHKTFRLEKMQLLGNEFSDQMFVAVMEKIK